MSEINSQIKAQLHLISASNLGDMPTTKEWLEKNYKPHSGFRIPALMAARYRDRTDRQMFAPVPAAEKRLVIQMQEIVMGKQCFTDVYGRCMRCMFAGHNLYRMQDSHGNNYLMDGDALRNLIV